MKFKAVVEVKFVESSMKLECEVRDTYSEACEDGEISKVIWGDEFIGYQIVEV